MTFPIPDLRRLLDTPEAYGVRRGVYKLVLSTEKRYLRPTAYRSHSYSSAYEGSIRSLPRGSSWHVFTTWETAPLRIRTCDARLWRRFRNHLCSSGRRASAPHRSDGPYPYGFSLEIPVLHGWWSASGWCSGAQCSQLYETMQPRRAVTMSIALTNREIPPD